MKRTLMLNAVALCICFACPAPGSAQTAKDFAGTWALVSNVNVGQDGSRTDVFGPHAKGVAMFGSGGHFAIINVNPDTPKFASNNRLLGTSEENVAVALGSIALYGTYSVSGKVVVLNVEASSYPNWTGTQQKRNVAAFSANEFKFTFPGMGGGTSEVTFRRVE